MSRKYLLRDWNTRLLLLDLWCPTRASCWRYKLTLSKSRHVFFALSEMELLVARMHMAM